jgi:hypothetical protein
MRTWFLPACLAASLSTACSDGYPTSDAPSRWSTYPPPPEEVTTVLNDLGRQPEAAPRWVYRFAEPCMLTIVRDREVRAVDLRGHWVHTRTAADADAQHVVALEILGASGAADVVVFASTRWRSVLEAASALKQLSGTCPRQD